MAESITRKQITVVFCAMLGFCVAAAAIGTFAPVLLGESGIWFRWITYAMAAVGLVAAFGMRAHFLKHLPPSERNARTIQRQ